MARADLIPTLIKASRQGDDGQVRKAVEALAADERAKNHTIRADRLLVQLQSGNGRHGRQTPLLSRSASGPLVANPVLVRSLSDLILSSAAEEAVTELVAEQHRAGLMRLCSLEPRNRVLLAAPPRNGKTTLVEALAHALNVRRRVGRQVAFRQCRETSKSVTLDRCTPATSVIRSHFYHPRRLRTLNHVVAVSASRSLAIPRPWKCLNED